jgi:hypothetical protein
VQANAHRGDGVDTGAPIYWTSVAYNLPGRRRAGVLYRADQIAATHGALAADAYSNTGCWTAEAGRHIWMLALNGNTEHPNSEIRAYAACMHLKVASAVAFDHVTVYEMRRA